MDKHRIRNAMPPLYAILIMLGFLISSTVGLVVVIVGALLFGLFWSVLSGGAPGGGRDRSARAARRSGRR
jgi:hypothetical protein